MKAIHKFSLGMAEKASVMMPDDIQQNYSHLGCGGIFVQMELMMHVWESDRV